jgi:endonuclease/exonuclease/phosphatase family metal-dependent hydrolase
MSNKRLFLLVVAAAVALVACTTADKRQRTHYETEIHPDAVIADRHDSPVEILRVASLNIAHGRNDSVNQLLVSADRLRENLDEVARVLDEHRPHVVALQEADAESRWSGSFDHLVYLATASGYPWRVHELSAQSWLFSFGTALLSVLPVMETVTHTFDASPPTLDKGFVLAQIDWASDDGNTTRKVDILSVHLDFSRKSVRQQQIAEMVDILSSRNNPTIIMGDFNSEWLAEETVIKQLAQTSHFKTYMPESDYYNTYKNKRLDWILISNDMEFVSYRVLPDTLSDHAMILADIRFRKSVDSKPNRL